MYREFTAIADNVPPPGKHLLARPTACPTNEIGDGKC